MHVAAAATERHTGVWILAKGGSGPVLPTQRDGLHSRRHKRVTVLLQGEATPLTANPL